MPNAWLCAACPLPLLFQACAVQEEAAQKARQEAADKQERRQRTAASMAADNKRQLELKVCASMPVQLCSSGATAESRNTSQRLEAHAGTHQQHDPTALCRTCIVS